jgi:selenocysteine lyase/cysteine desulfurase
MSTRLDVATARAQTPGCAAVVHLDAAGAALPPRAVTESVIEHLRLEERVGGYRAAELSAERYERIYDQLATLLGCDRDEIALTDSCTRAFQLAAHSVPLRPGDRVLISRAEYASNVIGLVQLSRRTGAEIVPVQTAPDGTVDLEAFARALDERARLVVLTHVPSNDGMVNRAREVGRITRAAGIPFLLDACQSIGQMPVDVEDIGCELLVGAGRKFLRGPRGTGFLYVRRTFLERLDPVMLDLVGARIDGSGQIVPRSGVRRFEPFERSVALCLGLGAAVEHALGWGLDAIQERVLELAERLRRELSALPGVRLCDGGTQKSAIVTFIVEGKDVDELREQLAREGVLLWTTGRHAPLDGPPPEPSRVLRASPHYYSDDDDLDRFLALLSATISRRSAGRAP